MRTISEIKGINFSIVEQRQQALELLNKTPKMQNFFNYDVRFPNSLLICENQGDWPRKFQQLRSALCFKSRYDEAKLKTDPRSIAEGPGLDNFSDASQAFWNATTNILDQIVNGHGVFTREEFENYVSTRWVVPVVQGAQQNPPP